jgi:hypothetical protein
MRLLAVRRRLPLVAVVLTAAVAFPLGALANHSFSDVPTGHPFHGDIAAVKDSGVSTTGCGGGKFCPEDFVTRGQMAAFLNRLGALAPGKAPVVNADKVDGHDEVLAAGTIVNSQQGPWVINGGNVATITHSYDVDSIRHPTTGGTAVQLPVEGPMSIGGTTYGLSSVQICMGGGDATILTTSVAQTVSPGSSVNRIVDSTDRAAGDDACYTVTDGTPDLRTGAVHLILDMLFSEPGAVIFLGNVTSTWVPVG